MLLFDAENAIPDVDAVAGAHVAEIFAIDGHAETVHAGQAPVRTAGPVVGPREAGVRNQAAEARPARVFLVTIKRVQVADTVREDDDRIGAGVAQILFRAQFAADQIACSRHTRFIDQTLGGLFADVQFRVCTHAFLRDRI